jgi:hypothetical protein
MNRKIYNIGRKLSSDDIGKTVVRTYPILHANGKYDWSCVPSGESSASLKIAAEKVIRVDETRIISKSALHDFDDEITSSFPNDSHWLTVEELMKHIQTPTYKPTYFAHCEVPSLYSYSGRIIKTPSSFTPSELRTKINPIEVEKIRKFVSERVIETMNKYFNQSPTANEGIWYPEDYKKWLKEHLNCEMDPSYFSGYADKEFFEKTGRFTFKLKEGKKASEALLSFLKGPTVADCGNATMACYCKCILDLLGEDRFNQIFDSNSFSITQNGITDTSSSISLFGEFTIMSKHMIPGSFGKRILKVGDECHFDGVTWYSNKHPEGFGNGWNVIYIGDDANGNQLFIGHGLEKPLTEREINRKFIELYNRERTAQDEQFAINANKPHLYDKNTNKYLKESYTIDPEEAEKHPEKYIKGFLTGSARNLNAQELYNFSENFNSRSLMKEDELKQEIDHILKCTAEFDRFTSMIDRRPLGKSRIFQMLQSKNINRSPTYQTSPPLNWDDE